MKLCSAPHIIFNIILHHVKAGDRADGWQTQGVYLHTQKSKLFSLKKLPAKATEELHLVARFFPATEKVYFTHIGVAGLQKS